MMRANTSELLVLKKQADKYFVFVFDVAKKLLRQRFEVKLPISKPLLISAV